MQRRGPQTSFCGESEPPVIDVVRIRSFLCRVGVHDWQAVPQDQRGTVQNNQYVVQMMCTRCGKRKFESLWQDHDKGGGV
jgi:hypothetical protein